MFAVSGLGLAASLAGCSSATTSPPSGSAGSAPDTGGSGSGGYSSGGTTGSGGAASGGNTGSGGMSSGGKTGSGAGGSSGNGGASAGNGGANGGSGGSSASGAGGETSGSGGVLQSGSGGFGGSSVTESGGKGRADGSVGAGGGSTVTTGGHGGSSSGGAGGGSATGDAGGSSGSGSFALTSPDLAEGAHFDAKFTCASTAGTVGQLGNGVNPELDWSGAPAGTMSFAITFIDTTLGDTNPMGQHWAIWNIPATVTKFPQATATLTGDLAAAKQSGKFLTPCAQSLTNNMDDQYEFTVYALSTATLDITGTTVANALTALKAISPLGTAKLHGHAGLKGK